MFSFADPIEQIDTFCRNKETFLSALLEREKNNAVVEGELRAIRSVLQQIDHQKKQAERLEEKRRKSLICDGR